jgi:hypothetical protein
LVRQLRSPQSGKSGPQPSAHRGPRSSSSRGPRRPRGPARSAARGQTHSAARVYHRRSPRPVVCPGWPVHGTGRGSQYYSVDMAQNRLRHATAPPSAGLAGAGGMRVPCGRCVCRSRRARDSGRTSTRCAVFRQLGLPLRGVWALTSSELPRAVPDGPET